MRTIQDNSQEISQFDEQKSQNQTQSLLKNITFATPLPNLKFD